MLTWSLFFKAVACRLSVTAWSQKRNSFCRWIPKKQDFSSLSSFFFCFLFFSNSCRTWEPLMLLFFWGLISKKCDFKLMSSFKEWHGVECDMRNINTCSHSEKNSYRCWISECHFVCRPQGSTIYLFIYLFRFIYLSSHGHICVSHLA